MSFHSIVVPYDNSEPAKKALTQALEFCSETSDCRLHVISVVVPDARMFPTADPIVYNAEEYQSIFQQSLDQHREELETHVRPLVAALGDRSAVEVLSGESPAESIDAYVREQGADLIIMGSRGLGGIRGAFGSVSKGVLHKSSVPVLIVK